MLSGSMPKPSPLVLASSGSMSKPSPLVLASSVFMAGMLANVIKALAGFVRINKRLLALTGCQIISNPLGLVLSLNGGVSLGVGFTSGSGVGSQ